MTNQNKQSKEQVPWKEKTHCLVLYASELRI